MLNDCHITHATLSGAQTAASAALSGETACSSRMPAIPSMAEYDSVVQRLEARKLSPVCQISLICCVPFAGHKAIIQVINDFTCVNILPLLLLKSQDFKKIPVHLSPA